MVLWHAAAYCLPFAVNVMLNLYDVNCWVCRRCQARKHAREKRTSEVHFFYSYELHTSSYQCIIEIKMSMLLHRKWWALLFSSRPDINECVVNNGGCSEMCFNTLGGFMCSCREGFTPHSDNKTCVSKYISYQSLCVNRNDTQLIQFTRFWMLINPT